MVRLIFYSDMALFKAPTFSLKTLLITVVGSLLFPIPLGLILGFHHLAFDLSLNAMLFFFLSLGNGYISESMNISWIEAPGKKFILVSIFSLLYTLAIAILVPMFLGYVFYGNSIARSWQITSTEYLFTVVLITSVLSLFFSGRAFLQNWRQSEIQAAELREAQISAQYEALQNQINPHFLFNSLNVLSSLVYKNPDIAANFIKQLSTVYRYVLDARNHEVVTLEQETQALDAYVFLLKIRFREGLEVQNKLEEVKHWHIAPLTLQMLVENAVKHNSVQRDAPLQIRLYAEGEWIIIENNLQKKANRQESMGIGLSNIRKRYQYLSKQVVQIEETDNQFRVRIPALSIEKPLPKTLTNT